MRAYSASSEEALRDRDLLKDWAGEGFITEAQYRQMEPEIGCDLRRTNIFLRLVLALFTLIIVGAAAALFFVVFLQHAATQTNGIFLLLFAAICYAAAEFAVARARLYRYGIEEALAACSVGFLYTGLAVLISGSSYASKANGAEFLIPAAGAIASLWIWRRFGLPYAFLAAMIFVLGLPGFWIQSHSGQHLIVVAFYAAGLTAVAAVRYRNRWAYLDDAYSIVEALLWLGIYVAINLQLSSVNLLEQSWDNPRTADFSKTFYWATWVLTWCVPPAVLARGLRRKDRFVIAVGAIAAVLTLVTNKPYLGWPRHTWDPMLLGILLIGAALVTSRWLSKSPGGIRRGFTAKRLSGRDKRWMSAGSAALGLVSPQPVALSSQTGSPDVRFGGGDSGGGGASSDF